jgi:serine/threonine-protein kinase
MAKDPKDRFQAAGALAAAAREALLAEAPAPQLMELQHTWTEIPDPAPPVAVAAAWPDAAEPPGPEPEPAAEPATRAVPYVPTQLAAAYRVDDGNVIRPENIPPGPSLGPDGSRVPPGAAPGGPTRGRAWRRFGVPILIAAAALTVAIVLVVMASPGTKTGGPSAGQSTVSVPGFAAPTVAETLSVGGFPNYIQVAPNGQFAYITNTGTHMVTVLNTATDQVSGTIAIPQGPPQAVSFSPDSRTAYVSVYGNHSTPAIVFIDTATDKVTSTVPVNNHEPGPSATSPDGLSLYVPNHNMAQGGTGDNVLDVINLATKKVQSIPVKANPHWAVADNKTGLFYVTNHMSALVTVLNAKTNQIIRTIQTGETPHSEALSPDGSRLAVTSYSGNEVFLINTATDQMIKQITVGKEPLDITYSPDGRYLFTVNNLDNTVTVIDTADNLVIADIRTGKAPTSISVLPNGRQAYVTDENSGNIEILNLPE